MGAGFPRASYFPHKKATEVASLRKELSHMRVLLAAERKRHGRLEGALSKYQGLLERQITEQREAFQLLGQELRPFPLEAK